MISVYSLISENFESAVRLKINDERFKEGRELSLILRPRNSLAWSEKQLCQLRAWMTKQALDPATTYQVQSAFDLRVGKMVEDYWLYRRIINLNCENPSDSPNASILTNFLNSYWGSFFSGSRQGLLLNYQLDKTYIETSNGAVSLTKVNQLLEKIKSEIEVPLALESEKLGLGYFESQVVKSLDSYLFVNLALLMIIVFGSRVFFGTWRSGFLFITSLALALIWLTGMMVLAGHPQDFLMQTVVVILAASTLQDFSFFSFEQMKGRSLDFVQRHLFLPSFLTSLTTVIGFGSLCSSALVPVFRFGLWMSIAALLEWFIVLYFIPALGREFNFFRKWTRPTPHVTNFIKKMGHYKLPKARILLILVLFFSIYSFVNLKFDDQPHFIFKKNHSFRIGMERRLVDSGWSYPLSVVFEPGVDQEVKRNILRELHDSEIVFAVENMDDSFQWMTQNSSNLEKLLLRRDLYLSSPPTRYFSSDGHERAILYLKNADLQKLLNLQDKIKLICKTHCSMSGVILSYAEIASATGKTMFESLFLSMFMVSIVLVFLAYSRSFRSPYILVLSALFGPAFLGCLFWVSHVSVNMTTAVAAAALVGLAGDNAIQLIFSRRCITLESDFESRWPGAFVTTIMMVLTCCAFLLTDFSAPQSLAYIFSVGLIAGLVGDYFVLKKEF